MCVRGIFTLGNAKRYISDTKFIETYQSNFAYITYAGPFRSFSTRVWQNARANTVRRAMVCDVYFPFSKTL